MHARRHHAEGAEEDAETMKAPYETRINFRDDRTELPGFFNSADAVQAVAWEMSTGGLATGGGAIGDRGWIRYNTQHRTACCYLTPAERGGPGEVEGAGVARSLRLLRPHSSRGL